METVMNQKKMKEDGLWEYQFKGKVFSNLAAALIAYWDASDNDRSQEQIVRSDGKVFEIKSGVDLWKRT